MRSREVMSVAFLGAAIVTLQTGARTVRASDGRPSSGVEAAIAPPQDSSGSAVEETIFAGVIGRALIGDDMPASQTLQRSAARPSFRVRASNPAIVAGNRDVPRLTPPAAKPAVEANADWPIRERSQGYAQTSPCNTPGFVGSDPGLSPADSDVLGAAITPSPLPSRETSNGETGQIVCRNTIVSDR
jgi:hypothetical protein